MTTEPDRMLDRALAYAQHGWLVFPCRPEAKAPATRHGLRDATTDPEQIRYWWHRQPSANVAVATGWPGPDVLDVDQHGNAGNGFAACRRVKEVGLLDGAGGVVATPGGGLHFYFAGSRQSSGRLRHHHLDFRSAGGYVLAPPSQVGGKEYRLIWLGARSCNVDWRAVTGVLEPDRQLVGRSRVAVPVDVSRLAAWVERLGEGNRNCGLFWAACRAVEAGQTGILDDLAAAAARTGLPDREIARTITSACRSARISRQPGTQSGAA